MARFDTERNIVNRTDDSVFGVEVRAEVLNIEDGFGHFVEGFVDSREKAQETQNAYAGGYSMVDSTYFLIE